MAVKEKRGSRKSKTRIVIVDDHPVMRYGITRIINDETDLVVCGEAESDTQAFTVIAKLEPDVVIVDISLGQSDGLGLCHLLKLKHPGIPVLILSMHDETIYAQKALRSGARGYVMKSQPPEQFLEAIRRIRTGEIYVSDEVQRDVLHAYAGTGEDELSIVDTLSDRERQVFTLMGSGYTTARIAEKLLLSSKTVDTHRARIKLKLGITDMPRLLLAAAEWVDREGMHPSRL